MERILGLGRSIGLVVRQGSIVIGLLGMGLRKSFREAASYSQRLVFVGWFVVQIIGYLGQYVAIWVLIKRFGHLSGWSVFEVLFLYSINLLSYSLSGIFTIVFWRLDEDISNGRFDTFLTLPIASAVSYIAYGMNVPYLPHIVLSITFIGVALRELGISVDGAFIAWFVLTLVGATLIQGSITVALAAVAFWTNRSRRLVHAVIFQVREFSFYPISIFGRVMQLFFTFALPYAFVSYYPARVLFGKSDGYINLNFPFSTLVVGCLCWGVGCVVWRAGLRAYRSTGT